MIKRFLASTIILVLASALPVVGHAYVPGDPCRGAQGIAGMGSRSQLPVQLNLFTPNYYATCPEARGTIIYQAATESDAALAVQRHSQGSDPDNFPWVYYSSDLSLSPDEWAYMYTDVSHLISKPAPVSNINHFPVMLNGYGIGYNLSGCSAGDGLVLSAEDLAMIYSGVYTAWSQLAPRNPSLLGCNRLINVSVRQDEAASSVVLKEYMASALPTFEIYRQKKLNVFWPSTLTARCFGSGESGMGDCLLTPGRIGYIEYREAKARNIPMAKLINASKTAFAPSTNASAEWPDNCARAAQAAPTPFSTMDSGWTTFTLTKASDGYPLCAYSYMLVFNDLSRSYGGAMTTGRARNIVDYLYSINSNGTQSSLPTFGYGPIPSTLRDTVRAGIDGVNF